MKKRFLALITAAIVFLLTVAPASADVGNYTDTDLLVIYKVSSQGYILSPVALTSQVMINWSAPSVNFKSVSRKDLIAQTTMGAFSVYPSATMGVGTLSIRGVAKSLPNTGTYLHDTSTAVTGKYSDASETYYDSPDSCYGTTAFIAGSSGMQFNTTGQVDFSF
jgi:hypothetical protein